MSLKYIRNPIYFQGRKRSKDYFEGWYFKQVSADLRSTVSVIPGISKDVSDSHSFIQTIIHLTDASGDAFLETHYYRFPIGEFNCIDEPFSLTIGKNRFTRDGMALDLADGDFSLSGSVGFSGFTKIRTGPLHPNIMGFFAYLPFMECYHGIVSMDHDLQGSLLFKGREIAFDGGRGYIEKDWGTSFPKEYIWLQSNHFEKPQSSIMCSVAHIPFGAFSFQGFICNLTTDGKEYRFATYNGSRLVKLEYTEEALDLRITKGGLIFEVKARMLGGGLLKAPKLGSMHHTIKEGLSGTVGVRLSRKTGEIIFEGNGDPCGIELVKRIFREDAKLAGAADL
ncbi:MAG: tocopherol cyclase family protein [Saccharofermentanales bacterium]